MVRSVITFLLTLLIATSALGHGMAQGNLPPAGVVTLCTGHGYVTILIDADGQPVEQTVICPDCIVSAPLPDAPAPEPGQIQHAQPSHWSVSAPTQHRQELRGISHPRGPPTAA